MKERKKYTSTRKKAKQDNIKLKWHPTFNSYTRKTINKVLNLYKKKLELNLYRYATLYVPS
jgi:hypothetical protein